MLVNYRWNRSTEKLGHSDNLINPGLDNPKDSSNQTASHKTPSISRITASVSAAATKIA